jgi:hypothetical protein
MALAALVLAQAAAPAAAAPTDVVASPVASGGSSAGATSRYWTPRRMRRAEPLSIVIDRDSPDSPPARSPRTLAGATVNAELGDPSAYPDRTHGKVFFRLGRRSYTCSATVLDSPKGNVVITAGHCVHPGKPKKDFASKWTFVPGYEDGESPFGRFPFKRLYALRGWTRKGNYNYDIATAKLRGNKKFPDVEQAAGGGRGIDWDIPRDTTRQLDFDVWGYPVAGGQFDHRKLYVCHTSWALDDPEPEPRGEPPFGVGCDLTKGSSGGGWVTQSGVSGEPPFVNSVTSFSYDDHPNVLFGPYFAADTAGKLWGRATGLPVAASAAGR